MPRLPERFPPLRVSGGEPLDFGERLERRIQEHVEQTIEASLSGRSHSARAITGPVLFGVLSLGLLGVVIVAIVLVVKLLS